MSESTIVWITGQAEVTPDQLPDGESPYPWSFIGVFATEQEAVAACRGYGYFVGPATMGAAFRHDKHIPWPGAYYPDSGVPAQQ